MNRVKFDQMGIFDNLPGRVAVHGLVFNKEGKILLMLRSELDKDEANCWDPPGGGLEKDEDIENGFLRELKEEAGILAENVTKLLGSSGRGIGKRRRYRKWIFKRAKGRNRNFSGKCDYLCSS